MRIKRLYDLPVPLIGLTGGIACGKSTITKWLREEGFAVIDGDALVKQIYKTQEAKDFLVSEIKSDLVQNGEIDFPSLRYLVFNYGSIKLQVEQFIIKRLKNQFIQEFNRFKPKPKFVFYDTALIFEWGINKQCDKVVTVYAPKEIQLKRLMDRDIKCTSETAIKMIASQRDVEDKKRLADYVIDNSGDLEQTKENFNKFIKEFVC